MFILEAENRIDVETPKGKGVIWLITDYGTETSKVYTVIQDNGTLWEWLPNQIKVKDNITFGRKTKKDDNQRTSNL